MPLGRLLRALLLPVGLNLFACRGFSASSIYAILVNVDAHQAINLSEIIKGHITSYYKIEISGRKPDYGNVDLYGHVLYLFVQLAYRNM